MGSPELAVTSMSLQDRRQFDAGFFLLFFFRRLLPKVPRTIFPRRVRTSPLPI